MNILLTIRQLTDEFVFAQFGEVVNTKIIYDRITWQSRGFGIVEMKNKADVLKAIENVNGKEIKGMALFVEEYIERKNK